MAPIKFEESIKEKLEKRTLVPSEDAWSKLSNRLDQHQNKKRPPLFWWLGIAASLAVLLMISIVYFGIDQQETVMPTVVETVDEVNTTTKEQQINDNIKQSFEESIEQDKLLQNENSRKAVANVVKESKNEAQKVASTKNTTKFKSIEKASIIDSPQMEKLTDVATIDSQAISEALKESRSSDRKVTDNEIDSLLKLANKELLKDKVFKESTKTVDASALLRSVEEELEHSFRSKMLEALISGYETVRTAVANRNQ